MGSLDAKRTPVCHCYGSRYGYPGGSAWCAMLWTFCMFLDSNGSPEDQLISTDDTVARFLMTVALWPWPVPWTVGNMVSVVDRKPVDGAAVEVSVGRHLTTAFIVPLVRMPA